MIAFIFICAVNGVNHSQHRSSILSTCISWLVAHLVLLHFRDLERLAVALGFMSCIIGLYKDLFRCHAFMVRYRQDGFDTWGNIGWEEFS